MSINIIEHVKTPEKLKAFNERIKHLLDNKIEESEDAFDLACIKVILAHRKQCQDSLKLREINSQK